MSNVEKEKLMTIIETMLMRYPDDELLIINPKNYDGYDLDTGKRIRIVQEEYNNDKL